MSNAGRQFDVVIVGAGPAGSSTAIRLAQAGLSVAIAEQKRFPRQKLCGEFISPECLSHFAELGILEAMRIDAVPIERTVFYAQNGRSVAVPSEWFGSPHAIGLSRAEMDARLLDHAREIGVAVFDNSHVTGLVFEGGRGIGVAIRDERVVVAEITVDATGRSRVLAREVERSQGKTKRRRAGYVAFKMHLEGVSVPSTDCEIYGYRGGYGGCVQVENRLHNLCFIVSSEIARRYSGNATEIMQKVLFANRRAKDSLQAARIVGDQLAVPIETYGRGNLAPAPGLLTVGDAAAFIDPFTGSGILLALESSKILADSVAAEFAKPRRSFAKLAEGYERRYRSAFDDRLRISSLVRRAAFVPLLGETVVRTLALSRPLTRILARATR